MLIHNAIASPQQENIAQIFSTGALLSDNDAISFGVTNFDPKTLLQRHPSQGAETEQLRNQLSVINLPFSIELAQQEAYFVDRLSFNLSYIVQKQKMSEQGTDYNKDSIYGFNTAYNRDWFLENNWKLSTGIGQYLMHYQNQHDYNNPVSSFFKDELDGQYYNINSNAYILEPSVGLKYERLPDSWGYWTYKTRFQYFYGWSFGGDDSTRGANPEGWKFSNTVKTHLNVFSSQQQLESLYVKAERVDIGGKIPILLGTDYYYEFGLGVLINVKKLPDFIKNVGIGFNINLGSELEGGSIVLYFNEI
jgi:hypothetical protein